MIDPAADREDTAEPTVVAGSGASRTLGRYQLCFELASGGMATVFLARAEGMAGFEKLVAIKRIHPHLSKERAFIDMFLDEARIASLIDHPNVCSVFEFGEAAGTYYIAMEYLHGESFGRISRALRNRPDGGTRPQIAYCARIVADACEGLHAAHDLKDARGEPLHVVHRDVSPANLYVTYDGGVRVVDFGIATARNRLHQTATGTVKGKFAYMSPEQLRGGAVDRRADVWALGVVLWELVTQSRLFRRKTESETMFAVMEDPVPPPSVVNPAVPPQLDAIVARALERDPARRYPTARALGRDLVQFVAGTGQAIGLADIADWMEALFPESKAKKGQLLDIARQSEAVPQVAGEVSNTSQLSSGTRVRRVARKERRKSGAIVAAAVILGVGAGIAAVLGAKLKDGAAEATAEVAPLAEPAPAAEIETATTTETETTTATETETETATEIATETATEIATETATETAADVPTARPAAHRRRRAAQREVAVAASAMEADPAPPRPSPQPAAGPGQLIVVTPGGWADVYEAGRLLGQTPLRVELRSGRHVLDVRPFGRTPGQRRPVTIGAGETARVSVPVTPE